MINAIIVLDDCGSSADFVGDFLIFDLESLLTARCCQYHDAFFIVFEIMNRLTADTPTHLDGAGG